MIVYRVSKRSFARDLSGEGAKLAGGRWNTRGNPMLYTSATMGLALLESLVHTPAGTQPRDLVLITLKLPPRSVRSLVARKLPRDWNSVTISISTQRIGDEFLHACKHLALKVPSVILPGDHNVIVNPTHPGATSIEIMSIIALPVDPRLIK